MKIQFGLDTFGDMQHDYSSAFIGAGQPLRNVIAQGVLAD